MNNACFMKLGWNMRESKGNLWCSVLQGKYGRNREVNGELIAKTTDSFIWKGIVKVMDNISQFEEWSVGNGTSISAWRDKWLGDNIVLAQNVESIPENVINWKFKPYSNISINPTTTFISLSHRRSSEPISK
ncbi:hypothetical protein P8452_57800 [Trifolium repens]|nr:hypothetical protein P8452_57800 [Trifolium repens]